MGVHWNQRAQLKHPVPHIEFLQRGSETLCFPSAATGVSLHQSVVVPPVWVLCPALLTAWKDRCICLSKHTSSSTTFPSSLCLIFLLYISSNIYGDSLYQGSKFTISSSAPSLWCSLRLDFCPFSSPNQLLTMTSQLPNKLHIKILKTLRWPCSDHPVQTLCRTTFRANGDECWDHTPHVTLPEEQGWGML